MPDSETDVVIVGAGPAGAALAAALASAHRLNVLVLEREATPGFRIGETLPGAVGPVLRDLGLLASFSDRRYLRTLGRASLWGSGELSWEDAFTDPHGPGWRLDRADFEAWLIDEARQSGAEIVRPCRLVTIRRGEERSRSWAVAFASPCGGTSTVQSRFLVDATGRRAAVARRLGASAVRLDRLVCSYALGPAGSPTSLDGFSLVEATPQGWFYGARVPSGARLVAFHTDGDLASRGSREQDFADRVAATVVMREFLVPDGRPAEQISKTTRVAAWSGYSSACVGCDWAAVGDAACCFDPLSSQGLFNALYGALRLAPAIADALAGRRRALSDYAQRISSIWTAYQRHYMFYYALERRWPDQSFWRRRHILPSSVQR